MARKLERTFAWRHRTTALDLEAHGSRRAGPLDVLVSGSSGLIGRALLPYLTTGGHRVRGLPRTSDGEFAFAGLKGADAVVHLAGESVAGGRWTRRKRERIRSSRIEGTRRLVDALSGWSKPPRVLVSASAVGIFGDRGDEVLSEASAPGEGFLADIAREWEEEASRAERFGTRVVHVRFGMVLSPAGGALAKMLPVFRKGLGGRVGSGAQFVPWVGLDDALAAIGFAIDRDEISGPLNVVAPAPVTNREFTRTLARVLRSPAVLPVPAFAARLAFGRMADELLLASARVHPERLIAAGFRFRDPDLETALRWMLGRPVTAKERTT